MANYNLVTNSTFQPFTYNELMAPIQEIEKQYSDAESSISELESKVSFIKDTLPEDSEEYKKATAFLNDLDSGINDLRTKGASNTLSRKLFDLSRQYNKELVPLAQKTEMLKKAQDIRSQILAKDPTTIFVNDLPSVSDIKLGESIDNTVVPSASMIEDAYKGALSYVTYIYNGKNNFTQSESVKDKVVQSLSKNYNIDLSDPKYTQLKLQIDNAVDSGILKGVEDRKSNYLTTSNAELQYETYLSKLHEQQAEEHTKPYIYNAETKTYEKNPLIFDPKTGKLTDLGNTLYNKEKTDSGLPSYYVITTDAKGNKEAVINPVYLDRSGNPTEYGKNIGRKQGYLKDGKEETTTPIQKGIFYVDTDKPNEIHPADNIPEGSILLDPSSYISSEHFDYIKPGYNTWYYPGSGWFNRGRGYYYTHPSTDTTTKVTD